jgi:hypothetical protein
MFSKLTPSERALLGDITAIDGDIRPSHKRGTRRAKPNDELGHLLWVSNASNGMKWVHHWRVAIGVSRAPPNVQAQIAPLDSPQFFQSLYKCCEAGLPVLIFLSHVHEHANAPHSVRLLSACTSHAGSS